MSVSTLLRSADVTVSNVLPAATFKSNSLHLCTVGTETRRFALLQFRLPGGVPIDASRFTTLTFEYADVGTFNTRPMPGGGTYARVFWQDSRGARHATKSIMLYPNLHIAQVRLDSPDAVFAGVENGHGETGAPWAGSVTGFAINPIDDKASRCVVIGRVWLTADEPTGAQPAPGVPTAAKVAKAARIPSVVSAVRKKAAGRATYPRKASTTTKRPPKTTRR